MAYTYISSEQYAKCCPVFAKQSASKASTRSIAAFASNCVTRRRSASPQRNFVSPTGTIATFCTAGYSEYKSVSVLRSTSPSLSPGHITTCVYMLIPPSANCLSSGIMSRARGLPRSLRRIVSSVACTETYNGENFLSSMRASSLSERLVSVTKLPETKLSRQSSSLTYNVGRCPLGSWSTKQNTHLLAHHLGSM